MAVRYLHKVYRAIFADVMFINKPFQIEILQGAQTMKPLFRASNRQLLGSLRTITNTRIYAPACGIFDPKNPDSY